MEIKKNFVTFYSPGSFVSETEDREIETWDVEQACDMARTIKARYNAIPYAFQFYTKGRSDAELDSSVIDRSGLYYINCNKLSKEQIADEYGTSSILYRNMENNRWEYIARTIIGWKGHYPIENDDVVLDFRYE